MLKVICKKMIVTLALVVSFSTNALAGTTESPVAITLTVICDDSVAKKTFEESLSNYLHSFKGISVVDKHGYSNLLVYIEKTINNKANPNGYAIAVAHTNSYELRLAYQALNGIDDDKARAVRDAAEQALRQDIGLLRHLNVMHLDELTDEKLKLVAKVIVDDFVDRQIN